MKILTRYVLRQHVGPLFFALGALTALLLLNQVAKQFGNLVGKGLSWVVIGEFFLLSIPFIVAMTLPMAVLVAVLYTFSRLAAENEVTALKASGVGIFRLVVPVLLGATVLGGIMLAFNDQVLPRSNHRLRMLQADIARKKPTFALREQVINEVSPGKLFLKTGHIDQASSKLRDVTIYDLSDPLRRRTVYADSGQMRLSPDGTDLEMTLHSGSSQESPREDPGQLQRLYYSLDHVKVRGVANQLERTEEDNARSDREMSVCEMDSAFNERAGELRRARAELTEALVNATRHAATGERPRPTPDRSLAAAPRARPEPASRYGIGHLYCTYLMPVFGAGSTARDRPTRPGGTTAAPSQGRDAAELPGVDAPVATPIRVQVPPARRDTLGALEFAPSSGYSYERSVAATVAQLDAIRARVVDARMGLNRYDVEIQKKFALAAACVVFVLLGAPVALRFPRGGVGLVIGVSLVVFALYYIGLIAGETLADKLILSPVWAMWLANALFTAIGLVLLFRARKAGTTARGGDVREMLDGLRTWAARQGRRLRLPLDRRRRYA